VSLAGKNHTILFHLLNLLIMVVTICNSCSETMSVQTFHYVQTQLENCYDMLSSDKKKILLWSRRMHLALKAYKVKIFITGEGKHNTNIILRQHNNNLFSFCFTRPRYF
jgi:timeless